MTYDEFVERIGGIVRARNKYAMARCPAHPDQNASLSIKQDGDAVLFKCHAGCSFHDVLTAAQIDPSEWRHGVKTPKTIEYVYVDHNWKPIMKKHRGEGKEFWIEYYNGDGAWSSDRPASLPTVLFAMPDIAAGIKRGMTIHIHEGEKACVEFRKRGMVATCQPYGAGPGKWRSDYNAIFRGAKVQVWADRDPVGEAYATEVARSLMLVASDVAIVQSMTTGEHDDGYDHILKHDVELAIIRDDLLPVMGFNIRAAHSIAPVKMEYLWEPYIPKGKITLLDATEGTGKTSFLLGLSACLSNGELPFGDHKFEPVRTLYCGYEDADGELAQVLHGCGANVNNVFPWSEPFQLNASGISDLEATIKQNGISMLVLDALPYYMTSLVPNLNDAAKLQPVLRSLHSLAERTGCAIVGVRHMPKGNKTDGIGSVQFRATARSQILLRPHPMSDQFSGVIVATHNKGNLLTQTGKTFGYKRVGGGIHWLGVIEDPFIQVDDDAKLAEAIQVINQLCAGGPVSYKSFANALNNHQIPFEQQRYARRLLGAEVRDKGGTKHLFLPHH